MADSGDWAADMAERERQALIARARAVLPPPAPTRRGAVFDAAPPAAKRDDAER